jgi:hypothetical protein
VPAENSDADASGRCTLRIRCGVIDSTISVFWLSSRWLPNRRLTIGSSLKPGTLLEELRSSLLIRPASTWFSPSFNCSMVLASRVPSW